MSRNPTHPVGDALTPNPIMLQEPLWALAEQATKLGFNWSWPSSFTLLGTLRKSRQRRQREHGETKNLMNLYTLRPFGKEISTAIWSRFYFEINTTSICYATRKISHHQKRLTHRATGETLRDERRFVFSGNIFPHFAIVTFYTLH